MMSADQYITAMQRTFQPDQARGLDVTYHLQIHGAGSWSVAIKDDFYQIEAGTPPAATTTISMSVSDYVDLASGNLDVVAAYQQGQIQISGDLNVARKFVALFPPWAQYVGPASSESSDNSVGGIETEELGLDSFPTNLDEQIQPSDPPPNGFVVNPTLLNGSFDDYVPFVYEGEAKVWQEDQFPEMVGEHWQFDIIDVGRKRLHLMDSGTFGRFTQRYFGGGGNDYHIHGAHSQVITSRYSFDIVLRQTISAEVGRSYTFSGAMVSFYKGTASGATHDKIFLNIGIDPTGGTDYQRGSIVWSGRDGRNNEWRYPSVQATAQAEQITLFIRVENTEGDVGSTELNSIHLDNFQIQA